MREVERQVCAVDVGLPECIPRQDNVTRSTTQTEPEQLAEDASACAIASTVNGKMKPLGEPQLVVRQMRCQAQAGFVVHVQTLERNVHVQPWLRPYRDQRIRHVVAVG